MFSSILAWISNLFPRPSRAARRSVRRRFRPQLEVLEGRVLPAVTWTVDTTTDTDMGDPTKQAGSLRYCVQNAAQGDTIVFSNMIAGQTIQLNSPIFLGEKGLTNLTIDDGANNVSISGQNNSRLFVVLAGSSDAIQNLTLTNGFINDGSSGGAVLVAKGAALSLTEDLFLANSAVANGPILGNGGAIENDGTLTDNDSSFVGNSAAGSGGAIANTGALTETGSTFTNNTAQGNGGAIESNGGGIFQVMVDNSFFYGNSAVSGGAIDTSDNTTLTDDTFGGTQAGQLNTAIGGEGGALRTTLLASLTNDGFVGNVALVNNGAGGNGGAIANSGVLYIGNFTEFISNTAGTNGGAIDSHSGTGDAQTLVVSNTMFSDNKAQDGGAIATVDDTILSGDKFGVDFLNRVIAPNKASVSGGAVSAAAGATPSNTLKVFDSTFQGNQVPGASGTGGAIDTSVTTDVETSEFNSNQAAFGGAIDYGFNNDTTPPLTSSLIVNRSYFLNNSPPVTITGAGGAIETSVDINAGTVTATITNSTFFGNGFIPKGINFKNGVVDTGGGVDIHQTTAGTGSAAATLTNDTFFKNTADSSGGGIAMFITNTGAGTNTAALTSLTVNQNQAGVDSGGLFVSAAQNAVVSVDNSILAGNIVNAANYQGPVDVTLTNNNALKSRMRC